MIHKCKKCGEFIEAEGFCEDCIADDLAEHEDDEEPTICQDCNGSGEGKIPGTVCWNCRGIGSVDYCDVLGFM